MTRRSDSREMRWPCTVAARVDKETREAIIAAADARGEPQSTVLRELIEIGLGRIDVERPVRRRKVPVRDAPELASALALLRTVPGNLQRLYLAHSSSGILDSELIEAKRSVQEVCGRLRAALGADDRADP